MKKRSVKIAGHATSISLEDEFWAEIKMIAARNDISVNDYITQIDEERELSQAADGRTNNLSSALRLAVLKHYKAEQ